MFGWIKKHLILRSMEQALKQLNKEGKLAFLKAFFGGSKKATAVIMGIVVVLLKNLTSLDDDTIQKIVEMIMVYVIGQGAVDVALVMKDRK